MIVSSSVGAIDLLLSAGLLTVVSIILLRPDRRAQSASFLSLGVVLTLVWLRLGVLDVALAEAALGTGVASAILVWLAVGSPTASVGNTNDGHPSIPRWVSAGLGVTVGALTTTVLGSVIARSEDLPSAWAAELDAAMPGTGVDHEITGVLLAFRAYDTLLESAVLLLAAVTVLAVSRDTLVAGDDTATGELPPIVSWFVRLSAPVLLMLGLWLLFAGSSGPGGAFQSGAVLASLLILLHLAQVNLDCFTRRFLMPMLVVGVLVFILLGLLGPVTGHPWLSWPDAGAFVVVLVVEMFLTAGITAGLYLLYLAMENPGPVLVREPPGQAQKEREVGP